MARYKVALIGMYNYKVLGVRYLAAMLRENGLDCDLIFFKNFESGNMKKPSEIEYQQILNLLEELKPDLIGISVMSTLYLEAPRELTRRIRASLGNRTRIVWGGVYPTLFPAESLEYADLVLRGEGEAALLELVQELSQGEIPYAMQNLAYRQDGQTVINEVRPLENNLDILPFPVLGGEHIYYINHDKLVPGDPQLNNLTYEITCSRGCPFVCSYCSSLSLKKLYRGKGKFVRLRSVDNVMQELLEARQKMKRMRMALFWDEIFPDDLEWVQEFAKRYKQEIDLPFQIWGHPLRTRQEIIDILVDAGLSQVVIGIQSGSPRIRNKIFFRKESQDEIIEMSRVLAQARVPEVVYDFILDHPFETEEDFRLTLELCEKLYRPFTLQLHGLSFLPGTEIVKLAIKEGVVTPEEMERQQNLSLEEQYQGHYWFYGNEQVNYRRSQYWINLIYYAQFPWLYKLVKPVAVRTNLLEKNALPFKLLRRACNYFLFGRRVVKKLSWLYG
jgi:radical SAM superfamily enzyme YgiQ (UPF0313 family)